MEHTNIYAPPVSNLSLPVSDEQSVLYVVSPRKFVVMTLMTAGLYGIYWYYRNWALLKKDENLDVWPVARAIFAIFFTHSLFEKIDQRLSKANVSFFWNPGGLATFVVITMIAAGIVNQLSQRGIASPGSDLVGVLLIFVDCALLFRAQQAINAASGDIEGSANHRFTWANAIWMVVGIAQWTLIGFTIFNGYPLE